MSAEEPPQPSTSSDSLKRRVKIETNEVIIIDDGPTPAKKAESTATSSRQANGTDADSLMRQLQAESEALANQVKKLQEELQSKNTGSEVPPSENGDADTGTSDDISAVLMQLELEWEAKEALTNQVKELQQELALMREQVEKKSASGEGTSAGTYTQSDMDEVLKQLQTEWNEKEDLEGKVKLLEKELLDLKGSVTSVIHWSYWNGAQWIDITHLGTSSEIVEAVFRVQPRQKMNVLGGRTQYLLDFQQWQVQPLPVQRNLRRIENITYRRSITSIPTQSFPERWTPSANTMGCDLIPVDPNSGEFAEVSAHFRGSQINSVVRVQNQALWNRYKLEAGMLKEDDRRLFHGTTSVAADQIAQMNFDLRLCGESTGTRYGKGFYFTNSMSYALSYCKATDNPKTVICARVLLGDFTIGQNGVRVPPVNPKTGRPYDTTVDDVKAPAIFVKYRDSTCYPEYIVKVTV